MALTGQNTSLERDPMRRHLGVTNIVSEKNMENTHRPANAMEDCLNVVSMRKFRSLLLSQCLRYLCSRVRLDQFHQINYELKKRGYVKYGPDKLYCGKRKDHGHCYLGLGRMQLKCSLKTFYFYLSSFKENELYSSCAHVSFLLTSGTCMC